MSWKYTPPTSGQAITQAVLQAIETDLHTLGGNFDAAAWGLVNSGFVVLNPGELPGKISHTVTAASWAASVATLTIGSHNIAVNQLINVSGISPSGYNGTVLPVTAVTSTTVSFALNTNPGAYTSGGTLAVGPIAPVAGMMAADQTGNLWLYSGSAWVQQTITTVNLGTQVSGTLPIGNGGTGTGATLAGLMRGNASALTAAELSGDATTSGSNVVSVLKVNGGSLPVSAPLVGTNSSGQIILAAPFGVNAQSATYQVLVADFSNYKTIVVASGSFTITLVASGTQPANGQSIEIINYGTGTVTVARSGQNINGATTSLTLAPATSTAPTGAIIISDGSNYFANLFGNQSGTTNKVLATPNGSTGTASLRALVAADLPTITSLGLVTAYNGSSTTAIGVVPVFASVNLTGQTGTITNSTVLTVAFAGMYRINVTIQVTTPGSTSSTLPSLSLAYTQQDGGGANTPTLTATNSGNTTAAVMQASFIASVLNGHNLNFSTTGYASAGATAMQYSVHINLEYLG